MAFSKFDMFINIPLRNESSQANITLERFDIQVFSKMNFKIRSGVVLAVTIFVKVAVELVFILMGVDVVTEDPF